MQNASVIATFALVPILALVWLCGLPNAWRGSFRLSVMASVGLVAWPLLLIAVVRIFDQASGYGSLGFGVVMAGVIALGFAGLILSLLTGIACWSWRKSKEN